MNGFLIRVLISSVLLLGHSVTASENNAMSLIKQLPSAWYRLAASKGSGDAMWNLSAFYEKGLVVRRNCAYAAKLRAKAALLDSKGS